MPPTVIVQQSRAIPVTVSDAFSDTLSLPLPTLFRHRHGPIPPVKAVRDQAGDWGTAGQTRTVVLSDGGSMREELTAVDAPTAFRYRLTDIKGPLAPLLSHVEGEWLFSPAGTGTEVTWRWIMHPRSAFGRLAVIGFARLWRGYATKALAELSDQLLSARQHRRAR